MEKTYFIPTRTKTRERAEDGAVDVTDYDERQRERILRGMLRNMSPEWFVDEVKREVPDAAPEGESA